LAGALAQMHAEALAGVAVAQVMTPGTRILYGAFPIAMDLRTSDITVGSVEMGMMNASAVQLARLYRLPIYASGGVTEAKRPDIQAGFEKNFSDLTVAMGHGDIIHLTAGMVDSCNSISYEQFVIDNESLGMIKRVLQGITVNDDCLAFDVIREVGHGGNFITSDHTLAHMKQEYFYPELSVRCNYDSWKLQGEPDVMSQANKCVHQLLGHRQEGLLDTQLILEIEKAFPFIQNT
jgi:trimethylamine--corrinoid protein Co-methyltransferase